MGPRSEAQRTIDIDARLPRGVVLVHFNDGRSKPWGYRFGKERKLLSFPTEQERNDSVEKFLSGLETDGTAVLDFDPREWREWHTFKAETGATVEELRKLWARHSHALRHTILTKDAVARYLEMRLAEDIREKSDTYRHMEIALVDCLCGRYGHIPLAEIEAGWLRGVMDGLRNRSGTGPASAQTQKNYRKDWRTFFNRAVREGWIQENPCDKIIPPKVEAKDSPFLPLREVFQFFKAAVSSPIGARLAIEAFGGLRVSSSARMDEEEVDRHRGGLTLPANKHKLNKRFFLDGFPKNLFAWLDLPDQRWDISESTYDQYKGRAFAVAGVKNPGNVLRHSFCTYHIAAYRNAALTAHLLTHRNPTMLYQHYMGRGVSNAEGQAYFEITPKTVSLTWEQFAAQYIHEKPPVRSGSDRPGNRRSRKQARGAQESPGSPHSSQRDDTAPDAKAETGEA